MISKIVCARVRIGQNWPEDCSILRSIKSEIDLTFRCYDDENNPEMQLDQALENEMIYREPLMATTSS